MNPNAAPFVPRLPQASLGGHRLTNLDLTGFTLLSPVPTATPQDLVTSAQWTPLWSQLFKVEEERCARLQLKQPTPQRAYGGHVVANLERLARCVIDTRRRQYASKNHLVV